MGADLGMVCDDWVARNNPSVATCFVYISYVDKHFDMQKLLHQTLVRSVSKEPLLENTVQMTIQDCQTMSVRLFLM